jgi:hypothetical protein
LIWRVANSTRLPDSFTQILAWEFDDLIAANALIDSLDTAETTWREELKRKAKEKEH